MSTINTLQGPPGARFQSVELRRFLVILILALSPFLTCFGVLEVIAWRVGETVPAEQNAEWLNENQNRVWRGGDGRSYLSFQLARTLLLRPEVLMLGQSRASSLRAAQFEPYTFYNDNLTAWSWKQYQRFLELTTANGYAPRVLLCNVEYWMFTQGFDARVVQRFNETPPTHWEDLRIVVKGLVEYPREFIGGLSRTDRAKGIYSVIHSSGFAWDGFLWGPAPPPTAEHLEEQNDHIHVGNDPLFVKDHLDPEKIKDFQNFMDFAKSHGVSVVGITFPIYKRILNDLNANPWNGAWREFNDPNKRKFIDDSGMLYFNFVDMPEFRSDPANFADSIHPTETVGQELAKRVLVDPRMQLLLPNIKRHVSPNVATH